MLGGMDELGSKDLRSMVETAQLSSSEVLLDDGTWVDGPALPDRQLPGKIILNHYVSQLKSLLLEYHLDELNLSCCAKMCAAPLSGGRTILLANKRKDPPTPFMYKGRQKPGNVCLEAWVCTPDKDGNGDTAPFSCEWESTGECK